MAYVEPDADLLVPNKLWMGDLEPFMDEAFLRAAFGQHGYNVRSIKMTARYCFVEFNDPIVTRQVLERLNNQVIPGTNGLKRFKLNWACKRIDGNQQEYSVFVANLSREVTSYMLLEFFQRHYQSVRYAKVIEDDNGVSKGYGFVCFLDEAERSRSYTQLNGVPGLGKKNITIKPALAPKPNSRTPYMVPLHQLQPVYSPPGPVNPSTAYYPSWPQPNAAGYTGVNPQQAYATQYGGYAMQPGTAGYPMQPLQQSPIIQSTVVEDLEDPNPSIDVEAMNREVFQRDKELYMQLDDTRWNLDTAATLT